MWIESAGPGVGYFGHWKTHTRFLQKWPEIMRRGSEAAQLAPQGPPLFKASPTAEDARTSAKTGPLFLQFLVDLSDL